MEIVNFSASNFRNLKSINLNTHKNVNVIVGENAQGKTNIIEGIWCFTGLKSFRGSADNDFINFGEEKAEINIEFFSEEREQTAKILYEKDKKRKIFLNGVISNAATLSETFHAVVFSPEHLQLVKSGAEERRRFLNTAISSLYPSYREVLKKYKRAVTQRNAILKEARKNTYIYEFLEDYEKIIALLGSKIIMMRKKYLKRLKEYLPDIYFGISQQSEVLEAEYFSSAGETEEEIRENLKKAREEDIINATTSIGPHRDDILLTINGKSARSFGSQGQQRSIVLSIKMAEAKLMEKVTGEIPIILLDDVLSELDEKRQKYLLNNFEDRQVFITCCDKKNLETAERGKVFEVSSGEIRG